VIFSWNKLLRSVNQDILDERIIFSWIWKYQFKNLS